MRRRRWTGGETDTTDPYGQPTDVLWSTAAVLDRLLDEHLGCLYPQPENS